MSAGGEPGVTASEREVVDDFLARHPEIEVVEAFIVDANGLLRGKWVPRENVGKILDGAFRLPRSAYALDIWGQDVFGAGLALERGDPDGPCRPVVASLAPVPWARRPTAQLLLSMFLGDGEPFYGDPRHVLAAARGRLARHGLTAVVAGELEFYLLDRKRARGGGPQPPVSPLSGRRSWATQIYDIAETRAYEEVLSEIREACVRQGIPTDAAFRENGPCQFEINLNHVPDPLAAADHMVLMKRAVKSVALRHRMEATFLSKPYGERSGSGMHVHVSLLDDKGANVLAGRDAGGDARGSERLRHAVGGLLASMGDSMAVFAANANAFRRFQAESHAPNRASWGYDNRTAALRVPDSDRANTRIEHRVAGADANPYLAIAAILAGLERGLAEEIDPGPPAAGNAYESDAPVLPASWGEALAAFERSGFAQAALGADYCTLYAACKRQEMAILHRRVTDVEYDTYLNVH